MEIRMFTGTSMLLVVLPSLAMWLIASLGQPLWVFVLVWFIVFVAQIPFAFWIVGKVNSGERNNES